MKDMIPRQVGRTIQFFRYSNLAANTTATTEGTVGTSLSLTSKVIAATVSQYTAFVTLSDVLIDTAYDPMVQQAAELLGYSAGLSVDTITRNVIDATEGTLGGTTGPGLAPLSTFLRVADLRNARTQLQANDVQPMDDGDFLAIAHPFVTYDLVHDPAAAGFVDIFKYTAPASSALVRYEDRGTIGRVAGCKIIESTNVKSGGSPTLYRVYVFGKNGVGCVDLEGRGPSDVVDPTKQRFKINVVKGAPSIADPEGVIGAAVSYNFLFTALVLEGPAGIGGSYRFRVIDAQSTVG